MESSSSTNPNGTIQFPAFSPDFMPRVSTDYSKHDDLSLSHENSPVRESTQWMPRRHSTRAARWSGVNGGPPPYSTRHKRQKSLGEAFHNIRHRSGSVSQNAMEIAEALKAPVSPALVVSLIGELEQQRQQSDMHRRYSPSGTSHPSCQVHLRNKSSSPFPSPLH